MLTDEIKILIDNYFDGELSKSKEAFLFTELSQNIECRDYFRQMNKLKSAIQTANEDFPSELDKKILTGIRNTKKYPMIFWKTKLIPIASYTFILVFFLFSLFMFFEIKNYRAELKDSIRQLNEKQETINLLINGLPGVEIESELKNAIIIQAHL